MNEKQLFALISALQNDKVATMAKMSKELSAHVYHELTAELKGTLPDWTRPNNYNYLMEWDRHNINYSHYCELVDWPDLQDGGVFEQCIEDAIIRACIIYAMDYGWKPMAIVQDLKWASKYNVTTD